VSDLPRSAPDCRRSASDATALNVSVAHGKRIGSATRLIGGATGLTACATHFAAAAAHLITVHLSKSPAQRICTRAHVI